MLGTLRHRLPLPPKNLDFILKVLLTIYQLPSELEDDELYNPSETSASLHRQTQGSMAYSIMLFRFAQLNSEIKYILHSITRNVPRYTYPQIPDIALWQVDLHQRLQGLLAELPALIEETAHLDRICRIRYHEIVMLLFRPTPRIRTPTKESLMHCHRSAAVTIQLWKELYDSDRLSYSWITIHSICLSAITLLYCIWTVPEATTTTKIDVLLGTMQTSSNILSAAGEHWSEARRSRNKLDELTSATIRWLIDVRSNQNETNRSRSQSQRPVLSNNESAFNMDDESNNLPSFDFPGLDTYINGDDLAVFVGAPDSFAADLSLTMEGMFSEYQPLFDFNSQQDFGASFLG